MILSPFKEYHVVSGHVPSVHHFVHFSGETSHEIPPSVSILDC